tara:strand:+ start:180 stop:539 length:360 start_codon:yes stop_codon:yes gene_type:complete
MITVSFTDPQRAVHINSVLCILRANENTNTRENYSLSASDYETETVGTPIKRSNVNYRVCYWINLEAKQAGAEPYLLNTDTEMSRDISFEDNASYDDLTLVEKCEKHLLDVILAPMIEA